MLSRISQICGTKTLIMGVINATPDSFSGDGIDIDVDAALMQANHFVKNGVDLIDVGGESSRPPSIYRGVKPISVQDEIDRVVPIIETITSELDVRVSVDTFKSKVALEAIKKGASIVNDIWSFQKDADMANVVKNADVDVILMHNTDNPKYGDVVEDCIRALKIVVDRAVKFGVKRDRIVIDPGIGFAKTPTQNLEILRRLSEFKVLGLPILVGTSRKSTIGAVLGLPVDQRLEGTAATVAICITKGADIVRVHDVAEMSRVVRMSDAIVRGWIDK